MAAAMPNRKKVYLNDAVIGEASSWAEVHKLLKAQRIAFASKPGMAEGPTGFYITGHFAVGQIVPSKKADDVA
jgi:hypothetical protein